MSTVSNDLRLTAYALGELDAIERVEIEKLLESSPVAREFVEGVRQTAAYLTNSFQSEPAATLTADQRQQIQAANQSRDENGAPSDPPLRAPHDLAETTRRPRRWIPWAAAASIALLISGGALWYSHSAELSPARQIASAKAPTLSPSAQTALQTLGYVSAKLSPTQSAMPNSSAPPNGNTYVPLANGTTSESSEQLASAYKGQRNQDIAGDLTATPANPTEKSSPTIRQLNSTPKQWIAPTKLRKELLGENADQITDREEAQDHGTDQIQPSLQPAQPSPIAALPLNIDDGATETPAPARSKHWVHVSGRGGSRSTGRFPLKVHEFGSTGEADYAAREPSNSWTSGQPAQPAQPGSPPPNFRVYGGTPSDSDEELNKDGLIGASGFHPFRQPNTESYNPVTDNPFLRVLDAPLSTFSIDVDTASYANIRRFLTGNQLPPRDAVRIEEMVNYFSYDYPPPTGDDPFSVNVEIAQCPWNMPHRLARVGLKGKTFAERQRPPYNLVFLIDVSGSMEPANKLPLLKQAMTLLVEKLSPADRVAIVTYAGESGLALPSTTANNKETILHAINQLRADGSTNGGEGIQLAYRVAQENFNKEFVNRVILATDGDFNVGITNPDDLVGVIADKARSGVFLTVLGFGMGNLKDATLERLADKGNGNYAYIDNVSEARKVLVDQMTGTLVTIAKDVKIQIEFNPAVVGGYRLIGYENRLMPARDFNDDRKDAGEIGAGHTVTALYEIVPVGQPIHTTPGVDPLKYQTGVRDGNPAPVRDGAPVSVVPAAAVASGQPQLTSAAHSGEMMTIKLRYKQPDGDTSKVIERAVNDSGAIFSSTSTDFRFAGAVAGFGMILRDSPYKGDANLDNILEFAQGAVGADSGGYRTEFIELVRKARAIRGGRY